MNIRFFFLLLWICSIIFTIFFGWNAYGYYKAIHADDPIEPFLAIEVGNGKIIRDNEAILLTGKESYILKKDDIIETSHSTFWVITWPDKSITRLGENSRIVIRKMQVSRNYADIQISYDMKRGKVWNTVIRALLWDSYFEARLPKENIIAGVRGTIFEINLENNYIHAVEHATALSDSSGKWINLLPGELVSSENIWVKKWREWLDTTWQEWNTLKDAGYKELRLSTMKERISILVSENGGFFSSIQNTLLKNTIGTEESKILTMIRSGDAEWLASYSTETLLSALQRVPDLTDTSDREMLRQAILSKNVDEKLSRSLHLQSLWDSLDSGNITSSTQAYMESIGTNITSLKNEWFNTIDTEQLIQNLSGSLDILMKR